MSYFVDTNVLVYARDSSEGSKHDQARDWLAWLWEANQGRLSYQVLTEYYVTVTQRLDPGMAREQAQDDVEALEAWRPSVVDFGTLRSAWRVQRQFGFSWWDSLIVAAAQLVYPVSHSNHYNGPQNRADYQQ